MLCCQKATTQLLLLKLGGANPMTGVQLSMATGDSEGKGEGGVAEALPCTLKNRA